MTINRASIITSLIWKFMERLGVHGIQFVLQIILARILLPEDFGIIVLVVVFITVANVLVQSGFNIALIQKKETDELDYSTVFWVNLVFATVLYIILYLVSPVIANFFNESLLANVLKVLALTLFLGAISSIQLSILSKTMQFRKQFWGNLLGVLISGFAGVWLAYEGYGVWSLVVQQLLAQLCIVVIFFIFLDWRPQFVFSKDRAKILFNFGWKLLVAALIDTIYTNSRSLVIGKMYSSTMLAYYNRGEQLPSLIVNNINGSVQSVIFPALSAYQEDKVKVKNLVRRAVTLSSFIIFPMMAGLAAIAEPIIKVLFTDKWLESVPFVKIACLYFAFWPLHTANLQAINALGRSDIFLKLEIKKKIVGVLILIFTIPFGVYAIALGMVLGSIISVFINAAPNRSLLGYTYVEQFKDIFPNLIISSLMFIFVFMLNYLDISDLLKLPIQIISGVLFYIIASVFLKVESMNYIIKIMKKNRS